MMNNQCGCDINNLPTKVQTELDDEFEYFWPIPSDDCENNTCNCAMH